MGELDGAEARRGGERACAARGEGEAGAKADVDVPCSSRTDVLDDGEDDLDGHGSISAAILTWMKPWFDSQPWMCFVVSMATDWWIFQLWSWRMLRWLVEGERGEGDFFSDLDREGWQTLGLPPLWETSLLPHFI